jgi:hypothetical protein
MLFGVWIVNGPPWLTESMRSCTTRSSIDETSHLEFAIRVLGYVGAKARRLTGSPYRKKKKRQDQTQSLCRKFHARNSISRQSKEKKIVARTPLRQLHVLIACSGFF